MYLAIGRILQRLALASFSSPIHMFMVLSTIGHIHSSTWSLVTFTAKPWEDWCSEQWAYSWKPYPRCLAVAWPHTEVTMDYTQIAMKSKINASSVSYPSARSPEVPGALHSQKIQGGVWVESDNGLNWLWWNILLRFLQKTWPNECIDTGSPKTLKRACASEELWRLSFH